MKKLEHKVPNLRFKGFTDYWEQHKLGEIITYYNGKSHEEQFRNAETQNFELVTLKSIDGNGNLCSSEKYIDSTNNTLSKNDLIMVLSEQNTGLVGMTTLIPRDNYYVLNQRVALLKLHKNNSPFFLTDAINQHQIFFERMSAGTKVQNISKSNVENFNLYIPNYSEQKEVGHIIALCQNIITLQQRKLDLLKQFKKGLLQKMFADKDSKRPVLRFKGFHDDWEQRKVSDIFTVTRGQVLATTKISEVKTNEMCFPVYSSQTKNNGLMGYYNKYLFNTAITWTTDGANAGTVNYREGKFYSTNVNGVLLSDDGYANKAIAEILDRVAWRHVSRVGNPKLMNNVMSNIKISIPSSFEEQNAISEFLIKFDHLIVLHQRKQNHLKLLKKSLLQQMFM